MKMDSLVRAEDPTPPDGFDCGRTVRGMIAGLIIGATLWLMVGAAAWYLLRP